jgi:anti-anti-sigma regulatory factor
MSEEEVAWTKALEQKRKLLVHALAVGDLETAEQLKETIEEMERHARSRGWRLKEH